MTVHPPQPLLLLLLRLLLMMMMMMMTAELPLTAAAAAAAADVVQMLLLLKQSLISCFLIGLLHMLRLEGHREMGHSARLQLLLLLLVVVVGVLLLLLLLLGLLMLLNDMSALMLLLLLLVLSSPLVQLNRILLFLQPASIGVHKGVLESSCHVFGNEFLDVFLDVCLFCSFLFGQQTWVWSNGLTVLAV